MLLIGPYDLGNNLGHPITGELDPELKEAIANIHKAAVNAGKRTGIYCISGEQARMYADQGFHMVGRKLPSQVKFLTSSQISVVADVVALPTFLTESLSKAKGSYTHHAINAVKGAASSISGKKDGE